MICTDCEIIPVETSPVTLELAKKHLNIEADFTEDDELIQGYIDAATEDRANYMGRAIEEQRVYYKSAFDGFEFRAYTDAVVTVDYVSGDDEGVPVYSELPDVSFKAQKTSGSTVKLSYLGVMPGITEGDRAVRITVQTACPKPVRMAILLVLGDLYQFRENKGEIGTNRAADSLCRPYKEWY